jgi:hypothetical protein
MMARERPLQGAGLLNRKAIARAGANSSPPLRAIMIWDSGPPGRRAVKSLRRVSRPDLRRVSSPWGPRELESTTPSTAHCYHGGTRRSHGIPSRGSVRWASAGPGPVPAGAGAQSPGQAGPWSESSPPGGRGPSGPVTVKSKWAQRAGGSKARRHAPPPPQPPPQEARLGGWLSDSLHRGGSPVARRPI